MRKILIDGKHDLLLGASHCALAVIAVAETSVLVAVLEAVVAAIYFHMAWKTRA